MRGSSATSLAAAQERLAPEIARAGVDALGLSEQLFAVLDALDSSSALSRTLTDPSRPAESKAAVAKAVATDADPVIAEAFADLARSRWSATGDLADAVESLAFHAALASAAARDALGRAEGELFQLVRSLKPERQLLRALAYTASPPEARLRLVDSLLGGMTDPITKFIARRAALAPRGRKYLDILDSLANLIAERRGVLAATVTAAGDLTESQRERLTSLLEAAYGCTIALFVDIEPDVVGGLRVRVGADVIDSTVLARLHQARRRLQGIK